MIDLSRIPNDMVWGVICENKDDIAELVEAIKLQRKDISIGSFSDESRMCLEEYHGKAFFLNYRNTHHLQHGKPGLLPSGLMTMPIDQLRVCADLPEIQEDQVGALSIFGF